MAQGKEVVTKKGKGKDQYGRAFGKKQKAAMLEFTKNLWLQDATASLRNILQIEAGQKAFMEFLKLEYGEAQLEFFLEAQKLDRMDPASQVRVSQIVIRLLDLTRMTLIVCSFLSVCLACLSPSLPGCQCTRCV